MKNFITDFSGAMKALKLKLGTHMNSGLVYCVYQNQGQGPITLGVTSLDRFYKFPLMHFFFVPFFSKTVWVTKLKPGSHIEMGLMYHVHQNQSQGPISRGVSYVLHCHVTMSYSDVSGKHELKIFDHYGYFSSDSAGAGL